MIKAFLYSVDNSHSRVGDYNLMCMSYFRIVQVINITMSPPSLSPIKRGSVGDQNGITLSPTTNLVANMRHKRGPWILLVRNSESLRMKEKVSRQLALSVAWISA